MRRFLPRRAWAPLSDQEWAALAPFVARAPGTPGRPLLGTDPRGRMDAMLRMACSGEPWRALPEGHGRGATVARHFRRLPHAGLWSRLLEALCDPRAPRALRDMEYWLCRAARRAMRLLRMGGIVLARRLGLLSALPMWPWLMPDPDLSKTARDAIEAVLAKLPGELPAPGVLTSLGAVLAVAGGRPVWSRRLAPP